MKHQLMPFATGALMGPMMLWMLHGLLAGEGTSGVALILFVGAHGLVVTLLLTAAILGARLSPGMRARLDRVHRPSLRQVAPMLGTAIVAGLTVHLVVHGVA